MVRIILPALGQTQTLNTLGAFIGGESPEQITNATTLIGSTSNTSAQAIFKFYTTPNAGDLNLPATTSDVSNSNWTAVAKVGTAGVFVNPTDPGGTWTPGTQTDIRTGQHEMVFKLAEAIFGSSQAGDLLSNPSAIMTSFATSAAACATSANADTSTAATTELINGLINNAPQRFALKYNAAVTGALFTASTFKGLTAVGSGGAVSTVDVAMSTSTTVDTITATAHTAGTPFTIGESVVITDGYGGSDVVITLTLVTGQETVLNAGTGVITSPTTTATATMGTYTHIIATGGTSTATATITALCNSATSVLKLFVTTAATGTLFSKSELVTFTGGGGVGHNITIASINSVQTAMLNGTLSNTAGTEAPLEATDNLRIIFTVNSNAAQTNASGATVATAYKANFDFISA